MDQTLRAFDEGQMVAEAAFKQHADAVVTANIGGRDQGDIFTRAHVAQLIRLCQYEEPSGYRGFDLRKFLAEILDKDIVKPSSDLHPFLPDHFESFIELRQGLLGHETPGFQGLLYFRIFGQFASSL